MAVSDGSFHGGKGGGKEKSTPCSLQQLANTPQKQNVLIYTSLFTINGSKTNNKK